MRLHEILDEIADFLEREEARWALVGGLALATYGISRMTVDVDLLVAKADRDRLVSFLEARDFETLHRSEGYSHHRRGGDLVDIVYVEGSTAEEMFSQARRMDGPGGRPISVPRPEHLAAMKVFAMKNDPSREVMELADLRSILSLPHIDRQMIRGYFERHGFADRFDRLTEMADDQA